MTRNEDESIANADLDRLLRTHLVERLDAHRGRALAAFERETNAVRAAPRRRLIGLIIGSAIAASLASAWLLLPRESGDGGRSEIAVETRDPSAGSPAATNRFLPSDAESLILSQAIDEGSEIIDELPLRRVRLRSIEEIRWDDPDLDATVRMAVPREEVILVRQQTF
jgi:hypothetical protein